MNVKHYGMIFGIGLLWGCDVFEGPLDTDTDTDADTDTDTDTDTDADADADTDSDTDTDTDSDTDADSDWARPYDSVVFRSTHNSYSGGPRGGILSQLDGGIRGIEFDFHDNQFVDEGGYVVGHNSPGGEVDWSDENPGPLLSDWLNAVADWSRANPTHAPITVVLDMKDDLTDNPNQSEGNLGALNAVLHSTMGSLLYPAHSFPGAWPSLGALRGKIIPVLSGDAGTRLGYIRDRGSQPAVAMNDAGQIVEVHKSPSQNTLWYWTGQLQSDGTVDWKRHGQYDTGVTPSVTLDNDGWLVAVHRSASQNRLYYRVGQLDADYEITWSESQKYDDGVDPTLRFDDLDGFALTEIHTSQNDASQNWFWEATLNRTTWRLEFGDHDKTSEDLFVDDSATASMGTVTVYSGADDSGGSDTLHYTSDKGTEARIRYEQLAFMELQSGYNAQLLQPSARFFAVKSGSAESAAEWAELGWVTRVWDYASNDTTHALPHMPATDIPNEAWYQALFTDENSAE